MGAGDGDEEGLVGGEEAAGAAIMGQLREKRSATEARSREKGLPFAFHPFFLSNKLTAALFFPFFSYFIKLLPTFF